MIYIIEIKEEAKQDVLQASDWYFNKSPALNLKFVAQVELILKAISKNPKAFKKIYKNFRQAALKKFPYVIIYEYNDSDIIIFSVFHTSQHPHKKLKRLKK